MHRIGTVECNSIARELGVEAGDYLVDIDGQPVLDVLDYRFRTACSHLSITFASKNGQRLTADIEKDAHEDLGIEFDEPLLSQKRSCANRCIFCFVDQLPKQARQSLRFKDDDWRLSFLQGNFVTLTNVGDAELSRIIDQRISPLNISVQTTDQALRIRMMQNDRAGNLHRQLKALYDGQIAFYAQIVVCPGWNDKEQLTRSLNDLVTYRPYAKGVAIVPVGLTAYRHGTEPLSPVLKEDAQDAIARVRAFEKQHGEGFVHLADEFYLLAEEPIPPRDAYGDFAQMEDGVGLLRHLIDGFNDALADAKRGSQHTLSVATGEASYPVIRALCDKAEEVLGVKVYVYPIANRFFGGGVSVTGLLTGKCLREGLAGKPLGERLLLCSCMTRHADDVFLDDMTIEELSQSLDIDIVLVDNDGASLLDAFMTERE